MNSRAVLPDRLRTLLTAPANVAVHGSPGSGKSWIADRVIAELDLDTLRIVRIDLSTVKSGSELFAEVSGSIPDAKHRADAPPAELSTRAAWRSAREKISNSDKRVILVLDQFDRVLQFDDGQEFLLLFRELVHRPETLPCTALIISRRSLQAIESKVRGISTLASVCYAEFLGAITIKDLETFAPGASGLDAEEAGECLRWSGGHPALVKYWLTIRPDRDPAPAAEMERARVFLRVVDYLVDIGLVDAAAQLVLGPLVEDLLFERQELELLGVTCSSDAESATDASLADSDIFRGALRHRTWDLDPWGVLGRAEVRLRTLVDAQLSSTYGDDWPALVAKKNPAVMRARADALEKMERDRKMFARQAPWLSYTYPGDLWTIIQVEWIEFQPVFAKNDKNYWRGVLMGLAQYRAPLAHGRPEVLGEAQRIQCRMFAAEVIEAINNFEMGSVKLVGD